MQHYFKIDRLSKETRRLTAGLDILFEV